MNSARMLMAMALLLVAATAERSLGKEPDPQEQIGATSTNGPPDTNSWYLTVYTHYPVKIRFCRSDRGGVLKTTQAGEKLKIGLLRGDWFAVFRSTQEIEDIDYAVGYVDGTQIYSEPPSSSVSNWSAIVDSMQPLGPAELCRRSESRRMAGQYEGAVASAQKAIDIVEEFRGSLHKELAICFHVLGNAHLQEKNYIRAEEAFARALAIDSAQNGGTNTIQFSIDLYGLAQCAYGTGKNEQAERAMLTSLSIRTGIMGEHAPCVTEVLCGLEDLCRETGRVNEAMEYRRRVNENQKIAQIAQSKARANTWRTPASDKESYDTYIEQQADKQRRRMEKESFENRARIDVQKKLILDALNR